MRTNLMINRKQAPPNRSRIVGCLMLRILNIRSEVSLSLSPLPSMTCSYSAPDWL